MTWGAAARQTGLALPRSPQRGRRGREGRRGEPFREHRCWLYAFLPIGGPLRCERARSAIMAPGRECAKKRPQGRLRPGAGAVGHEAPEGGAAGGPGDLRKERCALWNIVAGGGITTASNRWNNAQWTVQGLPTTEHASAHTGGNFQAGGCRTWPKRRAGRPIAGGFWARLTGPKSSARYVGKKVGRNSRGTKARPTRPAYRRCYGAFLAP